MAHGKPELSDMERVIAMRDAVLKGCLRRRRWKRKAERKV
jgi:hypothetical protein